MQSTLEQGRKLLFMSQAEIDALKVDGQLDPRLMECVLDYVLSLVGDHQAIFKLGYDMAKHFDSRREEITLYWMAYVREIFVTASGGER